MVRLRAAQELRGASRRGIDYAAAARAYGRPVGRPRQIVVLDGATLPKTTPQAAPDKYSPLLQNLKEASKEYVALRPGRAGESMIRANH